MRVGGGTETPSSTTSFQQQLGARIRQGRAGKLTQEELASKVGLSRSSIANMERGVQTVSAEMLVRLASALDLEPATLLPAIAEANGVTVDRETMRSAQMPEGLIERVLGHLDEARGGRNAAKARTSGHRAARAASD